MAFRTRSWLGPKSAVRIILFLVLYLVGLSLLPPAATAGHALLVAAFGAIARA